MTQRIKPDVLKALEDWKAGKPVKSLELGHTHRMSHDEDYMASHPNARNSIDLSKRVSNDQERAHAYCFAIIEFEKDDLDSEHDTFMKVCGMLLRERFGEVTPEEATAAQSLAWKALQVGWAKAIAGHPWEDYIEISNSAAVQAT